MSAENVRADSERRRTELRDFLHSRRARLTPADVGMPEAGRRRTPGLRREEVAVLAGVGVSWYTRLEQGRADNVSGEVLDAVARTLRMSQAERRHLYLLSGLNPPLAPAAPPGGVPAELHRLLQAWAPRPAYIRDRHWNLVAFGPTVEELLGYGENDHNCLVTFFTNARYRELQPEWAQAARGVVARFRGDAARYPEDPRFDAIADDLRSVSPEFAELWARHEVAEDGQAVKAVAHPDHGDLVFEATLLTVPDLPGYNMVMYNPKPGTGTAEALERLAARELPARVG
ncbi:helix-turn-helix transcriptional regulator [Nocardiopsis composta]|uniref:Transcriptional regulator with XRE-family HTH domain n=1 Tax=Nocardiopsis composta TaxID=157465 RepID=A0A7W8QSB2_9ACTN|nr:helix-turn-helix transcriptional regulator [Nocardiopsis composta]MBB5434691.1 transcriptional regulator with XRE-family HTH domain [Nocardiopsis composta]